MLSLLHEALQQDILDHGVTVLRFLIGMVKDDYVFTIAVSSILGRTEAIKITSHQFENRHHQATLAIMGI